MFLSISRPTALLEGLKTIVTSKTLWKYALFQNINADWDCKSAYNKISIILIFISEATFHTLIQILHWFGGEGDKNESKGREGEERLKKGNKRERDRKRGLIRGRKGGETGRVRERQTNRLIKGRKGGDK